jgi:CPA2 family monovalent cation:H+ antiporter-2
LIGGDTFQAFINTSILTMVGTPFIMQVSPWFADRFRLLQPESPGLANVCSLTGHTIIAGYGLNGRNLARTLRATRIPYTVLEVNADTIRKARDEGEPIIYGDITREDVLLRAGADCARVIVFAISDFSATRMAIRFVRSINPSIFILVRTRYAAEVDELLKLGADQVIAEEFETSIEIFSRVLHQYHIPGNIIANQISLVRFDGYKMLRGLSLDQEKIGRLAALFAAATVDNVQVQPECACIGKSLRDLDIRRTSGATVLAIVRNGEAVTNPGIDFRLEADDILVLLGAHKELDAAATLLTQRRGGSAAGTG